MKLTKTEARTLAAMIRGTRESAPLRVGSACDFWGAVPAVRRLAVKGLIEVRGEFYFTGPTFADLPSGLLVNN